MQLLRYSANIFKFCTKIYRTQVFHNLTNKQLATPELVKANLIERIPFHSRVSQVSLYHGKRVRHAVKTCFSEKKTKKFKRVHKIKKFVHSDILKKKLYIRMSIKAYRTMKRYGSFDRYILLTSPKNMDSKMGEYYRQLMMRKINDPSYRIPYIIGSGKVKKIKNYQKYYWHKQANKLVVPKQYKKDLLTLQRKFGTSVQELNNEDYQKYLQVQRLKKLWGKDVDRKHPLLLQIQQKINAGLSEEQIRIMQEKAQQIKQQYLGDPRHKELKQQMYDFNQKQAQKQSAKVRQAWIKYTIKGQQYVQQDQK